MIAFFLTIYKYPRACFFQVVFKEHAHHTREVALTVLGHVATIPYYGRKDQESRGPQPNAKP